MILDEIVLHNFGLYADRQSITLTPPSADQPVILFGGLNGAGKTTLLDAFQVCLYGPFAKIADRNNVSYQDYLARSVHRGSKAKEAAIEIAFRHTIEGREDHYRLHRSWKVTPSGCKEHFQVLKNDQLDIALADNWISQVEDLFPPNIAHLFLFDGEQIEGYAAHENSQRLIGSAIQNLLGLDIVDQLEKDLQVYERRKRTEEKDDAGRSEIKEAEATVKELRSRIESLKQEQAALRTHKLDRKRKALADADNQYRKLGGELYDQRTEIEKRKSEAESRVEEGASALRELAVNELPLLLVRDLLESAQTRDAEEEEGRRAREVASVLEDRDKKILKQLRSQSVDGSAVKALQTYLTKDRKQRAKRGAQETVLDLLPEVRADLHSLIRDQLESQARDARTALQRHADAQSVAEHIQIEHASIPSPDAIAEVLNIRDGLREEIEKLEAEFAALSAEIERTMREIERRQQALTRLLEADAKTEAGRQDRERILRHALKVRGTLGKFRQAVIVRHVKRIEQLVLESYQQLLRKSSLVTRLTIDPEKFNLTLYGRDGSVLTAERLSAGERQLLAIALLWGLAKASGRPLPTAIDTPLGRLDTSHRMHLVERYFPYASHQVLLFSTDEEITGAYLQSLKPYIGRSYHLAYDDASGSTHVLPGYFEERKAA